MDKIFLPLPQPTTAFQSSLHSNSPLPTIILSQRAYQKMSIWTSWAVKRNRAETSGLGTIVPRHGGLYVSDIWLIKPEAVGHANVDMDPAAVGMLMYELYEKGHNMKNLRFHWHTHADFGVGWSGVDDNTARNVFCPEADWTVSVVTNDKGHFLARQDFPRSKSNPRHNLPVKLMLAVPGPLSMQYRNYYDELHAGATNRWSPSVSQVITDSVQTPPASQLVESAAPVAGEVATGSSDPIVG